MNGDPVVIAPPVLQDINFEMRECIKVLHRVLNRERDYRDQGRPFDITEVVEGALHAARTLASMAREIEKRRKGT